MCNLNLNYSLFLTAVVDDYGHAKVVVGISGSVSGSAIAQYQARAELGTWYG